MDAGVTVGPKQDNLINEVNYTIIASSKFAKIFFDYIKDKFKMYHALAELKSISQVAFFRFHFEYEAFQFIFPFSNTDTWLSSVTSSSIYIGKYQNEENIEFHRIISNDIENKQIIKLFIQIAFVFHIFEWKKLSDTEEIEYAKSISKEFLNNFKEDNLEGEDEIEGVKQEFEYLIEEFNNSNDEFFRIDIHPHDLPIFRLKKKPKSRSKNSIKSKKDIKTTIDFKKIYKNEFCLLNNKGAPWFDKYLAYKYIELQIDTSNNSNLDNYLKMLDKEFQDHLDNLQLVDGYGEEEEQKLRQLVNSIINDKLANRTSNKLIVGPQGTGKSSFSKLLSRLMNSKLVILECGPLSDNSDFYGNYEIHVDKETKQAITTFAYNGFMYASKIVNEGEKVVLSVEEYNLLPSETLLKQLNRFFQDRIIASMGGRFEVDNEEKKGDLIVILTGNHEFNQDWLEDVGLTRRFDFFELHLPSTSSVADCLFKYVKSPINKKFLSFELAERIAEIRDDLVASLNEKTIRPILSKEIKYPDLYTLRNFTIDLLHNVDVTTATKRWLTKIILGGIPLDIELREEYEDYEKIILRTVEDRLPENYKDLFIS